MTRKKLVARAGKGLLGLFRQLLRGVVVLCTAFGTFILFAFRNEKFIKNDSADATNAGDRIVGQDEAEQYGWESW